jgi:NifU-like protein involved in Fe-S cluster formation
MNVPDRDAGDALGASVRALFGDLAHAGELSPVSTEWLAGTVLTGEAGRVAEGTRVRFSLRLAGRHVRQARYRAYGCPYTLASCEWLARRLTGQELPRQSAAALVAAVGTPADWAAALGIPAARLGRLLIIEDALQRTLDSAVLL